jgi:hypothetical protein
MELDGQAKEQTRQPGKIEPENQSSLFTQRELPQPLVLQNRWLGI